MIFFAMLSKKYFIQHIFSLFTFYHFSTDTSRYNKDIKFKFTHTTRVEYIERRDKVY